MIARQAIVWPCAPKIGWSANAAASSSPLMRSASPSRSRSSPVSAELIVLNSPSPAVLDSTAAVEACRVKWPNWPTLAAILVAGSQAGHAGSAERPVRIGEDLGDDPAVVLVVVLQPGQVHQGGPDVGLVGLSVLAVSLTGSVRAGLRGGASGQSLRTGPQGLRASGQRRDLAGQGEVVRGQAADRVRAEGQRHLVPLDGDVGVVVGALGEVGDGPDVQQGVFEVGTLGNRGDRIAVAGPGGDGGEFGGDLGLGEKVHDSGIPFADDIIRGTAEADPVACGP